VTAAIPDVHLKLHVEFSMRSFGRLVLDLEHGQSQEFMLAKDEIILGRSAIADIRLDDSSVSRNHAAISFEDEKVVLADLGSSNGTELNGELVKRAELVPGDRIRIGRSHLRFQSLPVTTPPSLTSTLLLTREEIEAAVSQDALATTIVSTKEDRLAILTPKETKEIILVPDSQTLGRDPSNEIVIEDASVSRHHARIDYQRGAYTVHDLGSANGTWFGQERVDSHLLQDGDCVQLGRVRLVFKRGFTLDDLADDSTVRPKASKRPVVFIPGGMGTEIWRGSEQIWPNPRHLFSNPEMLRLPENDQLTVGGIVKDVVLFPNLVKLERYSRFTDYLVETLGYEVGKDLLEFGYDWRQDLRLAARRLGQAIDEWDIGAPVTIIAHSMGCLVARYYVERLGGARNVERLMLVGGPLNGFPKGVAFLATGRNLLPFGLMSRRIGEMLRTFPAFHQILPMAACVVDQNGNKFSALQDESWTASDAQRELVRDARKFRRELGSTVSVPSVSIFGYGLKTVTDLRVQRDSDGRWSSVDLVEGPAGDAFIPEVCAVLDNTEIHPVLQCHGSLYVDSDVRMRLKLELARPSRA
jgi:pSer/pThr/pTyr-binding forkhead associated (FHA) protein